MEQLKFSQLEELNICMKKGKANSKKSLQNWVHEDCGICLAGNSWNCYKLWGKRVF